MCCPVDVEDAEAELDAAGEDLDEDSTEADDPSPSSFRIVMLLQGPEVAQLLVEVCDDDGLARGGQDYLHVGLGLHLSLGIVTSTVRGLGLKMINIIFLVIFSVLQLVIF